MLTLEGLIAVLSLCIAALVLAMSSDTTIIIKHSNSRPCPSQR